MFEKITRAYRGVKRSKTWHQEFGPKAPKVGDPAPDFALCDVNDKNPICLSQFIDKIPVALVFGSFT